MDAAERSMKSSGDTGRINRKDGSLWSTDGQSSSSSASCSSSSSTSTDMTGASSQKATSADDALKILLGQTTGSSLAGNKYTSSSQIQNGQPRTGAGYFRMRSSHRLPYAMDKDNETSASTKDEVKDNSEERRTRRSRTPEGHDVSDDPDKPSSRPKPKVPSTAPPKLSEESSSTKIPVTSSIVIKENGSVPRGKEIEGQENDGTGPSTNNMSKIERISITKSSNMKGKNSSPKSLFSSKTSVKSAVAKFEASTTATNSDTVEPQTNMSTAGQPTSTDITTPKRSSQKSEDKEGSRTVSKSVSPTQTSPPPLVTKVPSPPSTPSEPPPELPLTSPPPLTPQKVEETSTPPTTTTTAPSTVEQNIIEVSTSPTATITTTTSSPSEELPTKKTTTDQETKQETTSQLQVSTFTFEVNSESSPTTTTEDSGTGSLTPEISPQIDDEMTYLQISSSENHLSAPSTDSKGKHTPPGDQNAPEIMPTDDHNGSSLATKDISSPPVEVVPLVELHETKSSQETHVTKSSNEPAAPEAAMDVQSDQNDLVFGTRVPESRNRYKNSPWRASAPDISTEAQETLRKVIQSRTAGDNTEQRQSHLASGIHTSEHTVPDTRLSHLLGGGQNLTAEHIRAKLRETHGSNPAPSTSEIIRMRLRETQDAPRMGDTAKGGREVSSSSTAQSVGGNTLSVDDTIKRLEMVKKMRNRLSSSGPPEDEYSQPEPEIDVDVAERYAKTQEKIQQEIDRMKERVIKTEMMFIQKSLDDEAVATKSPRGGPVRATHLGSSGSMNEDDEEQDDNDVKEEHYYNSSRNAELAQTAQKLDYYRHKQSQADNLCNAKIDRLLSGVGQRFNDYQSNVIGQYISPSSHNVTHVLYGTGDRRSGRTSDRDYGRLRRTMSTDRIRYRSSGDDENFVGQFYTKNPFDV